MSAKVKPLDQLLRKYLVDLSSKYARVHNDRRQTGKKVSQLGFQILAIYRRRHSPRLCRQGCLTEGPLWARSRIKRTAPDWQCTGLPYSCHSPIPASAPQETSILPAEIQNAALKNHSCALSDRRCHRPTKESDCRNIRRTKFGPTRTGRVPTTRLGLSRQTRLCQVGTFPGKPRPAWVPRRFGASRRPINATNSVRSRTVSGFPSCR